MRLSTFSAPGFEDMIHRIRSADAAFTNFETIIHNFDIPGAAVSGGTYMGSPPWVTDELKWAGFTLLSVANNHAFDFGPEGMISTRRVLAQSGLTFAGSGENLGIARSPSYVETKKGRIALIACASTFTPASVAGQQRIDLPGRPGINPLRFTVTYTVDPATFASLHMLEHLTSPGPDMSVVGKSGFKFLGASFKSGDAPAMHTTANPTDLREITASVRDARNQADWVMVSVHCHEGAAGDRNVPPEFFVTLAHAAIDSGADLVVGHGPHLVRGVEIYKGRPIFYSLGDFVFENETIRFQPTENYDSVGLPPSALPSDFFTARSKNDTVSYPADREYWEGVYAECSFDALHTLVSVRFHAIELGFKQPRPQRGRPYPASDADAHRIIERLDRLCKPMGTGVRFEDGGGTLVWSPTGQP